MYLSLVYTSHATRPFSHEQLVSLLAECRQKNERHQITGMLLHNQQDNFIQVIEGQRDMIESLYEKICLDKRHDYVACLGRREIKEREFADWSMGFQEIEDAKGVELPGFNDFMQAKQTEDYLHQHPGFALSLLLYFRDRQD